MKDLIIIGAGGFGRETAGLVKRINKLLHPTWNFLGFVDDNKDLIGKYIGDYIVLGDIDWLNGYIENNDVYIVCSVANTKIREKIIGRLKDPKLATLIDPNVVIVDKANIGDGCIISAGNILNVDITIGNNVIINMDCTLGHDTVLEDYVTIYPSVNLSGYTHIEKFVEIGTGTQILQGLKVGSGAVIGAGSVVVKNLEGDCVAVGVPCRVIKSDV